MADAKRILVIDDNVDLAENVKEILDDEGYRVDVAGGGSEALDKLAAEDFDLVITDMRMPGMNGVEVIHYIKERWPGLPVIVMTAYSKDSLLDQAQAEGALGVLPKPFDLDHLTQYVARVSEAETPVLVVEDDPDLRSNIVQVLQEIPGVVPHPAADAHTATRLSERIAFRAAVIDIRLPDADGLALGQALKSRYVDNSFSLVYITGYAPEIGEALGRVLHADGVTLLEKPFDTSALVEKVQDIL